MSETIAVPRELLDQLAPAEPISQDELGGCVWCGMGPGPTGYEQATADPSSHTPDCPWLAARALLDADATDADPVVWVDRRYVGATKDGTPVSGIIDAALPTADFVANRFNRRWRMLLVHAPGGRVIGSIAPKSVNGKHRTWWAER